MNNDINRKIFLDTETTGMNKPGIHYKGHQIIEIGAVEMINRKLTGNNFHVYLKPNRMIDPKVFDIHGISDEFLLDKPTFSDVANEFMTFINNSELIIHNASFDVGFINYELDMLNNNFDNIESICTIIDSLQLARKKFPGKKNNIDALCDRYYINRNHRILHGALLDAEILANIFLMMTGGQTIFSFKTQSELKQNGKKINSPETTKYHRPALKIIYASKEERKVHENKLDIMQEHYGICLWRNHSAK